MCIYSRGIGPRQDRVTLLHEKKQKVQGKQDTTSSSLIRSEIGFTKVAGASSGGMARVLDPDPLNKDAKLGSHVGQVPSDLLMDLFLICEVDQVSGPVVSQIEGIRGLSLGCKSICLASPLRIGWWMRRGCWPSQLGLFRIPW